MEGEVVEDQSSCGQFLTQNVVSNVVDCGLNQVQGTAASNIVV